MNDLEKLTEDQIAEVFSALREEGEDSDTGECWSECEGFASMDDFYRYLNGGVGGLV